MFLLKGFRLVLDLFLETCWCQKDDQKAKGGFVEMLVYLNNIAVFVDGGFHLGCQSKRKTEWDSDLD